MALADYGKIGAFVVDRINQVADWLKKRKRRSDVQGMAKDVADNDNASINKRVSDLQRKAKNRDDSR